MPLWKLKDLNLHYNHIWSLLSYLYAILPHFFIVIVPSAAIYVADS
jgi:hypothetical protein